MSLFNRLSIRSKLTLLAAFAAGIALLLACLAFSVNDVLRTRNFTAAHLSGLADVLAANTTAPLIFGQPDPATEVLSSLRFEPIVEYACIYNQAGEVFASYRRDERVSEATAAASEGFSGHRFTHDGRLHVATPISDRDGEFGRLYLRAGTEHLYADMLINVATAVVVLGIALVIATGLSSMLQRRIAAPILDLAQTADHISKNRDYSMRVAGKNGGELESLYSAFNRMLDEVQSAEAELLRAHDDLENRVAQRTGELTSANKSLEKEVAERIRAEQELKVLQSQLIETARSAGMAEVASSVLHNVGNVLNSVNISACLVAEGVNNLNIRDFVRATGMMEEHLEGLSEFISSDQRGRHLPKFLIALSAEMSNRQQEVVGEIHALVNNIDHIKQIVALQQSYAGGLGVSEILSIAALLDDAIQINDASMCRHSVTIERIYDDIEPVPIDKHKFLQIVINLIRNAKDAVVQQAAEGGRISVRLSRVTDEAICVEVADNGIGIAQDHLYRIFSHGFTTKSSGHGFGLHSAALAAKELGGTLTAESLGPGKGSTFRLQLPVKDAKHRVPLGQRGNAQ